MEFDDHVHSGNTRRNRKRTEEGTRSANLRKVPLNGTSGAREDAIEFDVSEYASEEGDNFEESGPPISHFSGNVGLFQPAVRIDEIVHIYGPLAKPHIEWEISYFECVLPVLLNRVNFIAGGCSKEAIDQWQIFVDELDKFLDSNPTYRKLNNHAYISFEFTGGSIPSAFFADIATTDASVNIMPTVRSDGSNSNALYAVASIEAATFLAKRMKGFHPSICSYTFRCNALTVW